jgi:hypothetical protein
MRGFSLLLLTVAVFCLTGCPSTVRISDYPGDDVLPIDSHLVDLKQPFIGAYHVFQIPVSGHNHIVGSLPPGVPSAIHYGIVNNTADVATVRITSTSPSVVAWIGSTGVTSVTIEPGNAEVVKVTVVPQGSGMGPWTVSLSLSSSVPGVGNVAWDLKDS